MAGEKEKIFIDCYGRFHRRSISIAVEGFEVCFVFAEQDKDGLDFDLALFVNYHALGKSYLRYPKSRRFCALLEPLASHHFRKKPSLAKRYAAVFVHDRTLIEKGSSFLETPFGTSWVAGAELQERYPKERLVSFIGGVHHKDDSEGHGLRNRVAEMLLADTRVDCFGKGIRFIESKLEELARYAFSVAMENRQQDYYFTEKIIDCFLTLTVPIYWGCPSIARFFDTRGIIIFQRSSELPDILESLSVYRYQKMLPYVRRNREKAIAMGWHSLEGLYARIAAGMLTLAPSSSPVRFRQKWVCLLSSLKNRILW